MQEYGQRILKYKNITSCYLIARANTGKAEGRTESDTRIINVRYIT